MFQGLITGFREASEAFLLIVVMHRYLKSVSAKNFRHFINFGLITGIIFSGIIGYIFYLLNSYLNTDETGKLWEFGAGIVAMILVTTFILWMIRHRNDMPDQVKTELKNTMSKWSIFFLAFVITAREGVETVMFAFTSPEGLSFVYGNFLGIIIAAIFAVGVFYALIKVSIPTIMKITLGYLVLQAGYIFGYSLHELLSYLKETAMIAESHPLLVKLFDISKSLNGLFDHKTGTVGVPLNVLFGWYSRPEWIQFSIQYLYTGSIFLYWYLSNPTPKNIKLD